MRHVAARLLEWEGRWWLEEGGIGAAASVRQLVDPLRHRWEQGRLSWDQAYAVRARAGADKD